MPRPANSTMPQSTPPTQRTLQATQHWHGFQPQVADALRHTPSALPAGAQVDRDALAQAFWAWVQLLEHDASYEALDPLDFAHFAAGQLLYCLLTARPLKWPDHERVLEIQALVHTAHALLGTWRDALGAPALPAPPPASQTALWASVLENLREDSSLAVAYLDEFTGGEPVWRFPQLISERPAMLAAHRP